MKRVNNNYQCVNVSTETYTGKEMSPKGVGFSAIGYEVGFEKEGVDKQLWVVQIKNNKKVWFRKSGMPKVTHEEPLITTNEQSEKDNDNESINSNDSAKITESKKDEVSEIPKETITSSKKTDFNLFYKYYSNKLKDENKEKGLNKKPKEIQEETYSEWNRIKKNKAELTQLLLLINNKA